MRFSLRVSFLEQSLLGLSEAQHKFSELIRADQLSTERLETAQLVRGNALICLQVMKALIADQTNALKNRISVVHESF